MWLRRIGLITQPPSRAPTVVVIAKKKQAPPGRYSWCGNPAEIQGQVLVGSPNQQPQLSPSYHTTTVPFSSPATA
jgi:hypothetical protein